MMVMILHADQYCKTTKATKVDDDDDDDDDGEDKTTKVDRRLWQTSGDTQWVANLIMVIIMVMVIITMMMMMVMIIQWWWWWLWLFNGNEDKEDLTLTKLSLNNVKTGGVGNKSRVDHQVLKIINVSMKFFYLRFRFLCKIMCNQCRQGW